MESGKHIFLSYSREDTQIMRDLRSDLQKHNFKVWTDENLVPGTPSWKDAIEQAIEIAGCFIIILSPSAKKSKWVKEELNYAEAHEIPTFPILASGDHKESVPLGLTASQWVDIRNANLRESNISKLIMEINRLNEILKIRHYVVGVTMTVYEKNSVIPVNELTNIVKELWFPEELTTTLISDCVDLSLSQYTHPFDPYEGVDTLVATIKTNITRFTFVHYIRDLEFDYHINALDWINGGGRNLSAPHPFFRPFVRDLQKIADKKQFSYITPPDFLGVKQVSFLTLWEYSYTWSELIETACPDKGDGHDWKFLGELDTDTLVKLTTL